MLNVLNVLDELLSAGTDRRIHYMISKGGSEALLSALVKTAQCTSPNFTVLLPLLHLLAKVGHKDRMIGVKAEKAEAVLLILRLLQQNWENSRRAVACLWIITTFCSSDVVDVVDVFDVVEVVGVVDVVDVEDVVGEDVVNVVDAVDVICVDVVDVVDAVDVNGLDVVDVVDFVSVVVYLTCRRSCDSAGLIPKDRSEDESDEEQENEESEFHDYEDDLETDVNQLKARPDLDRPKEQLVQYAQFCPELHHNFQDQDPEQDVNSDNNIKVQDNKNPETFLSPSLPGEKQEKAELKGQDFHHHFLNCSGNQQEARNTMLDRLLEKYGVSVPHHDPQLYSCAAARTKSIAAFSILAFPDFWGHLPPSEPEPMANRKPHIQRKKVFEDIQRLVCPDDIINKVVFDTEDLRTPAGSLRFFSKFENGNLRMAVHIRRYEYDLIVNADVNSSSHQQWFYFEVSGMTANVPYRFNIINCEKGNSQFNYGMQPVVYSVKEALEGRPQWVRTGTEICYYRNHFRPCEGHRGHRLYTLTFTMTFKHEEDVCYVAYHYPYTFSGLQSHLQMLQKSIDPQKVFFRQQTLCNTLGGNVCPLITITAKPTSHTFTHLHQLRNRPCVFLTARVHPGECNSSWVMKGTLEFLCSDDAVAESLRESFIFKIIPMLNPDGVIHGNHRCSLTADDLNRQWLKPSPTLSPTIYHAKGLLYYLCSIGKTPLVFCDYHGHSRKKNVFLYGCSVKETLWQSGSPVNTASLKENPGYRTIAKTLDRIAPAFSFNSCNFLVEKSRASTARVVVWREMGVLRSYTMESTYNGCNQGIYKLEEMGMKFCQSLLTLTKNTISYNSRVIGHAAAILDLENSRMDHKSHNCFEDDEPACPENIEYSSSSQSYSTNELNEETDALGSDEDEDEDKDAEGHGRKTQAKKSPQFPHACCQDSHETLNLKSSSKINISMSNTYLS
ncbi:cytosolic carboxypeptidase 4 [Silurus meridionalis]|nr:cytosolic carboxypeptidase 4 [Silurus meridionalis]